MPRPRRDGRPAATPRKTKLSEFYLKNLEPQDRPFVVWDEYQRGLAVVVQPSGRKIYKAIYRHHRRVRWYHIGDAAAIDLSDARRLAGRVVYRVAEGADPQAEKMAERSRGTFEELATSYVEEWAKRRNRSWEQADALVKRHLIPKWGKLMAADISRADVRSMMARVKAKVVANQVLASASAIFAWAIKQEFLKTNPCQLVERNATKSRERVLSDSEVPLFWAAFDDAGLLASTALKMILLTGQRPGEVAHMHRAHIEDGWWTLPGEPDAATGWPGTKNKRTHRVWLPEAARALLAEMPESGLVFAGARGSAVSKLDAAMRDICEKLGAPRCTPHDLRRTHGTTIAALGFGRPAMDRIQNHAEGGVGSIYDRHSYADENKRVMEAVAARVMALVEDAPAAANVIEGKFARQNKSL